MLSLVAKLWHNPSHLISSRIDASGPWPWLCKHPTSAGADTGMLPLLQHLLTVLCPPSSWTWCNSSSLDRSPWTFVWGDARSQHWRDFAGSWHHVLLWDSLPWWPASLSWNPGSIWDSLNVKLEYGRVFCNTLQITSFLKSSHRRCCQKNLCISAEDEQDLLQGKATQNVSTPFYLYSWLLSVQ